VVFVIPVGAGSEEGGSSVTSGFERGLNELKRALREAAHAQRAATNVAGSRGNVRVSGRRNVVVAKNVGRTGTTIAAAHQDSPVRQERADDPGASEARRTRERRGT
jgi:hypothetical protein